MLNYADLIAVKGQKQISDMLNVLIMEDYQDRAKKRTLYQRYKNQFLPIHTYAPASDSKVAKVNRQINIDIYSQIINTKVGYLVGNPVSYSFESQADHDNFYQLYDSIGGYELDLETLKFMSCCGLGARLLYVTPEAKINCMNIQPEECLFIYDRSINEPQFAMRYYQIDEVDDGKQTPLLRVEWYDDRTVTFYVQKRTSNNERIFVLDETEKENPLPHGFGMIPLIAYSNNREMMGDAERALKMIDAYDRQVSNLDSELEQLRLAYLAFIGVKSPDNLEEMMKTGAIGISQPGADVKWIEKTLNSQAVEEHLQRLRKDIISTCQSVDVSELRASGNITGIAIKMAYTGLENNCSFTEQLYKRAQKRFVDCYSSHFSTTPINTDSMVMTFTRDQPVNLNEITQMVISLKGTVSQKTLLSQLPFIDDVDYELEQLELEKQGSVSFDLMEGTDETGGEEDTPELQESPQPAKE